MIEEEPRQKREFKPLEHFLIQFNIKRFFKGKDELLVIENKYFTVTKEMKDIIEKTRQPFLAGTYLGKSRGDKFFPSINFLNRFAEDTNHKIWVDEDTAWLFVCGRDIFTKGIIKTTKKVVNGTIALVLNEKNEILGFVKVIDLQSKNVAAKNILDIGDFLRRERNRRN